MYNDIRRDILPIETWDEFLKGVKDEKCYELPHRLSKESIIGTFGKKIKKIQNTYIEDVLQAFDYLQKNISAATKLDCILGDAEGDEDLNTSYTKKTSDGKLKLKCPFFQCQTETIKLKRHLLNVHKVSEENATYAALISAKMASVCVAEGKILPKIRKPHPPNTATFLVAKRHNYKLCAICNDIFKNIGQHLLSNHNFVKGALYEEAVQNAEVVPSCFTKNENKKVVPLKGEELVSAQKKYGEEVKKQTKTLSALKEKKIELINFNKSEEMNDEEHKKLKRLREDYNNLRFNRKEPSDCLRDWKESFLTYLEMTEYYSPSRGAAMAMTIILPYEDEKVRYST